MKLKKAGFTFFYSFAFIYILITMVCTNTSTVRAAESGTSGTCTWVIDDDGILTISPTDGVSGMLDSNTNGNGPWYNYRSQIKKVIVNPGVATGTGCYRLFYALSNCTEMDLSNLNTDSMTNCKEMFKNCTKLTALDLSRFNTSNVTSMFSMFESCYALSTLNISGFDTENVTTMQSMFSGCKALLALDVSGFNTSRVTIMANMFYNCQAIKDLDVSGFHTENVTTLQSMFSGCKSLTSLDVSRFNTSNTGNMSSMFSSCSSLRNIDVSKFDTSNVRNMGNMFKSCFYLENLDVSNFKTGNVTSMASMFSSCNRLTGIDVSGFNTSSVTSMSEMFYNCSRISILDMSGLDTSNVTDMSGMFNGCSSLSTVNMAGIDTGNVRYMNNMFRGCAFSSLNLSGFDTHSLIQTTSMFRGCDKLASLDLSTFSTDNITNMAEMFYGCSKLRALNISGFDTSSATNMYSMFSNCTSLEEIDLGPDFRFTDNQVTDTNQRASLPSPPAGTTTEKWIREDEAYGPFTSDELRNNYDANASAWAGKWVWELRPIKYMVEFTGEPGTAGSMPNVEYIASEDAILPVCTFYRFNYHLDHWEGSDGNSYDDQATIPANTFEPRYTLTLTAVMEQDDNDLVFTDGEADVYLIGGEQISLDNLPGGTGYQIWEETPAGWQLIEQVNPAGTVPANDTARATFTNEYVPGTATIQLIAAKTLDGRIPEAGAFRFELVDPEGNTVETAENTDVGTVMFDTLVFRQPGEFDYKIREVRGDDPGINYDVHEEQVHISVTDDGIGNLTAAAEYDQDGARFENETKPGSLTVSKETDGNGDPNEVFTFRIAVTDDYGRSLDSVHIIQPAA